MGTVSMGLILVAVGILLLAAEIWGFNGAYLIIRWWPVILIVLGIEILAYVFWSREEEPKIKFDGLSIFLTIMVILISCGVYGVHSIIKSEFSTGILAELGYFKNHTVITENYDFDPASVNKLQVNNSHGQIRVEHYNGDTIKVDSSIVIENNDEEKARQLAQHLVEITEGETLSINTRNQTLLEDNKNHRITVDYSIKVPRAMEFDFNNKYGTISLNGLQGKASVSNKFGTVEIRNHKGDIELENSFGETALKNITGRLDLDNNQGSLSWNSEFEVTEDARINCKFSNVYINLPANQKGTLEVSTKLGSITIGGFAHDFKVQEENNKQFLKETVGDSSPLIRIYADQGNVDLSGI